MPQYQHNTGHEVEPKDTRTPPPDTIETSRPPTARIGTFRMVCTVRMDPTERETEEEAQNGPPNCNTQTDS